MSDYNSPSNFFSPSDSDIYTPSDSDLTPSIDYLGPSSPRFSDVPAQYPNPARNRPPPNLPGYNQIVPSSSTSPPVLIPSTSPPVLIPSTSPPVLIPSTSPLVLIPSTSPTPTTYTNNAPSTTTNNTATTTTTNNSQSTGSTVTYTTVNTNNNNEIYPSHPPSNSVWCCLSVFLFFMFGGGIAFTFSPFSRMEGGKKEFFDYGE